MIGYTAVVDSPVGPLICLVDGTGSVAFIEFTTEHSLSELRARLEGSGFELQEDDERTSEVRRQLTEYFAGERRAFNLPLAMAGTPFQVQVWQELTRIPLGETRSYGEIARSIGRPGASRAVGAANGANPIPVVVPCHRVVGANGSLTGFGGGVEVKRWLLDHEARITRVDSPITGAVP